MRGPHGARARESKLHGKPGRGRGGRGPALARGVACGALALAWPGATVAMAEAEEQPGADAAQAGVGWTVRVLPEERVALVRGEVSGLDPGCPELVLAWADGWAFVRLPEPLLEGAPAARSDGLALSIDRADPYAWRVAKGDARALELEWIVPLRHRDLPAVREGRDAYEYPYLADDHGLLATATLFAQALERERPLAARVRFECPEAWDVLAPWPRAADASYAPGAALTADLVAVGAWRTRTVHLPGFEAVIAVAPGQGELFDLVGEPIERIVARELELFGRAPRERYLFLFGCSDVQGFAGSPKSGSMTLAVGGDARAVADRYLPHLVAHEFFHTWGASAGPLADDLRWLHEGVTDWYAHRVQTEVGLASREALEAALGERLAKVEASALAGRRGLVEAGGPAFFEGGADYELVYAGGLLVGAWLEGALRARGASLDELLRALWNAPREPEAEPHALADLLALVRERAGAGLAAELEALVREPLASRIALQLEAQGAVVAREGGRARAVRGVGDATR